MSEPNRVPVLRKLGDDGVLLATLNRPEKKNAFDDPQWDGLHDVLRDAREDPRVAVLVVTGAGGDFSAGQDLTAFGGSGAPREDGHASGYYGCMETLLAFDKPLVAATKGVGVGIGATFLLHCDVVFAGESTRLRMPFTRLGLVPEAASSLLLPRLVGPQRAADLLFSSEWIDAARALELGLVARVLPDDEVLDAAMARAAEYARFAVSSLRATKRTLLAALGDARERALEVENQGMAAQAGSPENIEAISAFAERREPDFARFRRLPEGES